VPVRARDVDRVADQSELEERALPLQVGEPRPRDLRAARKVDRPCGLQEVHVIARLEAEGRLLADRPDHHAVTLDTVRRVGMREVRYPSEGTRVLGLDLGELGLEVPDLALQLGRLLDHRRPFLGAGLSDQAGGAALVGAGAVDLGHEGASPVVEVPKTVEVGAVEPATGERGGDGVEVVSEQAWIDHGPEANGSPPVADSRCASLSRPCLVAAPGSRP
jgi:hypothetical protein